MPIASLREASFISTLHSRVNISHRGLLPGTTSGVLTFFSVSMSQLLNVIACGGITLNFLCGLKANDVAAPRIPKKKALWDLFWLRKCVVGFHDFMFTEG